MAILAKKLLYMNSRFCGNLGVRQAVQQRHPVVNLPRKGKYLSNQLEYTSCY
jgi:hypothetical protein